ncbi:hypothetical protein B0J17DRAFT_660588 [Rhizoctonia solani]|nr:hypothetical protein B0J17DRAFT_660588 [Rhizoctonia solani]
MKRDPSAEKKRRPTPRWWAMDDVSLTNICTCYLMMSLPEYVHKYRVSKSIRNDMDKG